MDRLRAMHLFQRVAELGSYARASHELGLSSSVASAAIKELEAHLVSSFCGGPRAASARRTRARGIWSGCVSSCRSWTTWKTR